MDLNFDEQPGEESPPEIIETLHPANAGISVTKFYCATSSQSGLKPVLQKVVMSFRMERSLHYLKHHFPFTLVNGEKNGKSFWL